MLYELGNMGFKQNYNFIAKYIEGHGCGTDSGDDYYVWDGTKLKHFGYSYGVGDAGISFGNTLTFPSSKGGINNLIIAEKYDGESLDIPSFEMCGEGYEFVYYSMSNQTLKYASDTLFEVPSIDLSLRNLVSKEFPKHSMQHYTFGDINKDGIDDALFFCVIQTDDYDYEPTSPMVGVAYGNSTGGFDLATHNTSIVQEGFVGVVLNILKEGVQVKSIYNVGYSSEGNELPHMSIFDFIYNKSDKQLSWNSITKAEAESDDYNAKWVNNVSYFKTKKISFEAAWGDSGNDE
jgi:hypothetical protein